MGDEHEDVIILYGPTWDAPSQMSKQHLARHWARRGRRVLYVEAPFHPFSLASRPREVARLIRRCLRGPDQVEPRLWVQACWQLYPYRSGWPLAGSRRTLEINQALIRPKLRALCQKLALSSPVVVVGTATALPVVDCLEPSLVLYHCSDDYTRQPNFPASFAQLERELMDRCDLVVCTAESLRRAKENLHPFTYTVPNGADVEHFSRSQLPDTPCVEELRTLSRPIVGYIGTLFRWVHQEMIAFAAKARPEWSFVFVGPICVDVGRIRGLPNVHLLGPRLYGDLPSFLKGFDVATVPFVSHDVTLRASPIKFYEYLASGVPVVATRLPDLEPFCGLVSLVGTPGEFLAALEHEISSDTRHRRLARMAEARNHSWETRFASIDRLIGEVLERRRSVSGPHGFAGRGTSTVNQSH